jgi:hypothetical protein
MLYRIVGEERDPVIAADPTLAQQAGEAPGGVVQLAVADGSPVVGRHHPGLIGRAAGSPRYPVAQQFRTGIRRHVASPRGFSSIIGILPAIKTSAARRFGKAAFGPMMD